MSSKLRILLVFLLLTGAMLSLDLVVKSWAFQHVAGEPVVMVGSAGDSGRLMIPPHPPVLVIDHVLALKLTLNEGAVFGLGQGYRWLFVAITLLATGIILYFVLRARPGQYLLLAMLVLILAGALGNLYDRIVYGAVRDMFWLLPGVHLPFGLTWPGGIREVYPWIFNLADVYLCLGIGLLFIRSFFHEPMIEIDPADASDPANSPSSAP